MIETRLLEYFLIVAQEENITKASQLLHISQPTLSRQMKQLETEVNQKLFIRSNHSIKLTEEGYLIRKRAREIIELIDKTTKEVNAVKNIKKSNINIGAAETVALKYLLQALNNIKFKYGNIHINMYSGNKEMILEKLEKGLIDIAVIGDEIDTKKYHDFVIPHYDQWIVLMTRDHPLASKNRITKEDLLKYPLICSREGMEKKLFNYFKENYEKLNIVGTYDLLYNATLMVKEKIGIALAYDNIINTIGDTTICKKNLSIPLTSINHIVVKKSDIITPLMERILEEIDLTLSSIEYKH